MFTIDKKKIIYTIIMSVLLLSFLSGCKPKEEIPDDGKDNEVVTDATDNNQTDEEASDDQGDVDVDEEPDTDTPDNEETDKVLELMVYYGDENAEHIISKPIEVESISPEVITEQLIAVKVLPEGVEVIKFEEQKENGAYALHIDFSEAFQTQIFQMGTAGEYIMINSVVNTFLDAYDADKVRITVEGMVLESGHAIYDDYLFFQSQDE
ncbi:GerMN domain-containing protein [Vallitaleaceae bacterium 9-2]